MDYAYSKALAWESASDLPYNSKTGKLCVTHDELEHYAKIVAYKVAHNISNGFPMDPNNDPLTYL